MRPPLLSRAVPVTVAAAATCLAVLPGVASAEPGEDPASGIRSNMGLCSAYLGGLPAPSDPVTGERLGGNARSGVNQLIKLLGPMLPDELDTPGELYRVRARQHPDAPASVECTPRPQPGPAQ